MQNAKFIKKVIIFSTAYFPFVGGAEVAVREITDRLSAIGWDMITARMDRKLPKFERIGNINVYRIGIGLPQFDKYLLAFWGHKFAQRLLQKNNSANSVGKYDVIWSIMASYGGFAAMFFKKRNSQIPFLLTLQEGDDPKYINKRVGVFKKWFKQIFTSADCIQCISKFLADWAKKMGAKRSIEVVPNGVDIDKFKNQNAKCKIAIQNLKNKLNIKENEKVIITTSRLVEKNGIKDLIDAVNILIKEYKLLAKLIVCGSGELKEKLELRVASYGLRDKVLFLGEVPHDELPKYLWISDVFCRPSLSEGLGNSFLEAMAVGLPIIGTPVGGIPDFLKNGETGWFCEVNNPESIARKIGYILDNENKENIERVVQNARKLAEEKYSWRMVAKRFKAIFNNLAIS